MRSDIKKIKYHLRFSGYCSINAQNWTKGYGIYCVFSGRSLKPSRPIYIGKTECLETRINDHRNDEKEMEEWMAEAVSLDPTREGLYVSYAILDSEEDCFFVEPAMIFRLQPLCNSHYIDRFPSDRPKTHIRMLGPNRLLYGSFTVYPDQIREFLRPYDWSD